MRLKCVLLVQHDCFSSFNQSGHCFLASSLPSPVLTLPNIVLDGKMSLFFSVRTNVLGVMVVGTCKKWMKPCNAVVVLVQETKGAHIKINIE